ncbi:MAG: putative toxin-antitoxin system toxin component, PIN family [Anaerolineales bacterium]|jgi:putative PIN family toxin of toxin-antitoxin system|nr:putative toxin-antitoxin system toxin component, PIN family [Anaerolineales bacterium]
MKRVVLDTNIFISSVLGSRLGIILDVWKNHKFTLIVSDEIIAEYLEVLNRPKFHISQEVITEISAFLFAYAEFVVPGESIQAVLDDPSDNKFIETAIAEQAEHIVSGDSHLPTLKTFRDIPIISANEFIAWFQPG